MAACSSSERAGAPLESLAATIRACRLCRDRPIGRPLPHEPRPVLRVSSTACILVAGQAPGTKVHASGWPFDDRSGERLRDWMGIDAVAFYDVSRIAIVPMGFCFPGQDSKGGDLPPRRECVATWHDRLFAALPPFRVTLAIGQHAQIYHFRRLGLPRADDLTATVRNWQVAAARGVFPLPHPSWRNTGWLKREPWFEMEILPALRAAIATALASTSEA